MYKEKQVFSTIALVGFMLVINACGPKGPLPPTLPATGQPLTTPDKVASPALKPPEPTAPTPPSVFPAGNTSAPKPAVPDTSPKGPTQFVVSNLTIASNSVRLEEFNTVTAKVTNTGTTIATYTAVIRVKPAWGDAAAVKILPQPSQNITLNPGESTTVIFRVNVVGNGSVVITIEDETDTYVVDSQI